MSSITQLALACLAIVAVVVLAVVFAEQLVYVMVAGFLVMAVVSWWFSGAKPERPTTW
jgi:Na+/citrate or Na+/malate symporter